MTLINSQCREKTLMKHKIFQNNCKIGELTANWTRLIKIGELELENGFKRIYYAVKLKTFLKISYHLHNFMHTLLAQC